MTAGSVLKSIELPTVPLLPDATISQGRKRSLSQRLGGILAEASLDALLLRHSSLEAELVTDARGLGRSAYPEDRITDRQSSPWIDHSARNELHCALLLLYQQHMKQPQAGDSYRTFRSEEEGGPRFLAKPPAGKLPDGKLPDGNPPGGNPRESPTPKRLSGRLEQASRRQVLPSPLLPSAHFGQEHISPA